MLLVPYKAELDHLKIPFITIFIMVVCIIVLQKQTSSATSIAQHIEKFCQENDDISFRINIKKLTGSSDTYACESLLYTQVFDVEADKKFDDLLYQSEQVSGFSPLASQDYLREFFDDHFALFEQLNLHDVTGDMAYYPNNLNVPRMFSATLAHADWSHLIGNLFFFFAFAVTIEILIGPLRYLLLYACLAIGTALTYSLVSLGADQVIPTIGLSGVVMGMIGVFAYMMPKVRIKCFFWFLLFIRFFSIPAWLLALWFVGWDIYGQLTMSEFSNVNFVAHISGAFIGFIFGLLFLGNVKRDIASFI